MKKSIILTIGILAFLASITQAKSYDDIFPEKTSFGYVPIGQNGSKFFYWMAHSRNNPAKDPLVFWFQGGPGGSSLFGLFFEMGPFYIKNQGDDHATLRPNAWNNNANIVFIDHPIDVGFSVGQTKDLPHNAQDIGNQFYEFLVNFLNMPEFQSFKGRDLYITGESFAGHWVPYISNRLYFSKNPDVNLKGVMIGNGWMTTSHTYRWYPEFANQNRQYTKMTDNEYLETTTRAELCKQYIENDNRLYSFTKYQVCGPIYSEIRSTGGFNDYNIEMTTSYPDYISSFLNRSDVQQVLQVSKTWSEINYKIYKIFGNSDWWEDSSPYLVPLMQDPSIKVWWYNGDIDFICEWLGEDKAIQSIKWNNQSAWNQLVLQTCAYGQCKELPDQKVRFIKFANAGHMVPHDQIDLAVDLINDLIGFKKSEEL